MTKVKTHLAILYFLDEDTKKIRRVIFGDPKELYDFFLIQSVEMNKLLLSLKKEDPQTKEDFLGIIKEKGRLKGFVQSPAGIIGSKGLLDLAFEIREEEKSISNKN